MAGRKPDYRVMFAEDNGQGMEGVSLVERVMQWRTKMYADSYICTTDMRQNKKSRTI